MAAEEQPFLVEVIGPARHESDAVWGRCIVDGLQGQREATERLVPVLPDDDWRIVMRPLGSLSGLEEFLRGKQQQRRQHAS